METYDCPFNIKYQVDLNLKNICLVGNSLINRSAVKKRSAIVSFRNGLGDLLYCTEWKALLSY